MLPISAMMLLLCLSVPASAQTDGGGAPAPVSSPADASPPEAAPADSPAAAPADVSAPAQPVAGRPAQPSPAAPPVVDESAKALARGLNGFGWNLYRALAADDGNVFISPLSAAEALAMTHLGSAGATRDELAGALGFPSEGAALASAWQSLREALKSAGGSGEEDAVFALADSLWPDSSVRLEKSFLDALSQAFGPSLFPVDYRKDGEGARVAINDWTLDITRGRISELIGSPLPVETVLVLVNAVYFKGKWKDAFSPDDTAEGDFRASGGSAKAMFMNRTARFRYLEDDLGQVVELPYLGDRLSMTVLLPGEGDGKLAALEAATAGESLEARLAAMAPARVAVKLPRFQFAWGSRSLKAALEALGVKAAFTDSADFSGMAGTRNFKISDVFHKAFVDVNEEGTEAAAATAVTVTATAMPLPPVEFTADRPFLFLIRDNATGVVIFMGRFSGPSA
ncbi:MAG: serpin family protein [Deltaproteobacteria bacterium]|nr:serpin family protein [Deltaproteobacteria bacterium]